MKFVEIQLFLGRPEKRLNSRNKAIFTYIVLSFSYLHGGFKAQLIKMGKIFGCCNYGLHVARAVNAFYSLMWSHSKR